MEIVEKEKCEMERGYDPSRFIFQVKRDLLCCICHRVLKEPRLCEAEEHCFCLSCITQYLVKVSQTCPGCRAPLTLETLKLSQRFLKKVLSELRIRCDYNDRGCPEQVKLRNLEDHVTDCKYRPTLDAEQYNSQDETRGEVTELKRRHDDIYDQVKKMKTNVKELTPSQAELNIQPYIQPLQMARKQDQMKVGQDETKKALDEMKQTQSGINEKVVKMEVSFEVIKQQMERLEGLLGHLFQENIVNRNGAQATDPRIPTNNQDVIILGGWYAFRSTSPLNTVEKYNIVEKRSTMLPPLNHPRAGSASCVYNNDILVVGGYDGKDLTGTIEVLKMNQHPLRWTMFDGKLPVKLSAHDVIVYQGKLYIIGGDEGDERKTSNAIYEIALTPPYTAKLLTRMPEPRTFHKAELVNGKLFILGGTTTGLIKDALDSVVFYDLIKNEFKPCPSLPQPVCDMSTVTWGDKIIVLGGWDKNSHALNDVIMYDTETGQIEPLPSMIYKRSGSSVVIMNDVIVVFGGCNNEQGYLNSVEFFTIGGDGWKELPGMIERRWRATAVVKPHI
ncbi:ras guanine nucleotide exchange factor F-like [Dendronephthya gigantea]|uniref:ras guanine nucleotide exchange factor F-like n=1 Tax=Dendronephthya gigantea TaxID=151771 RepID=UPI00106C11B9|nr:ras guanine nucleotide exchange factor F-like [Dendronephthya gigantea]